MSGSVCRNCHGTIRFVKLDTGRAIPVEPHPSTELGNVAAIKVSGDNLTGYVIAATKPLKPGYALYVPHFASCNPGKAAPAPTPRPPSLFDAGAA